MDFDAMKVQNTQVVAPKAVEAVRNVSTAKAPEDGINVKTVNDAEKLSSIVMDAASDEEKAKEYTEKEVKNMIKAVNEKLSLVGKHFEYKVHSVTKQLMIKVVDSATKEVIKEIPPEKGQDALAKLWELAGILVDEKR